jgi:ribosomal protein S18 acetylase RimI-like enzyme
MKRDILIRRAQFDDLKSMSRLIAQLFAIETDFITDFEKQYRGLKLLFEDCCADLFVAKYRNNVVGMVTMQRLISSAEGGHSGLVEDLIVDERFRKIGVGTRLMHSLYEQAEAKGYARLQLSADRYNEPALEFYGSLGFVETNLHRYHRSLI